MSCEGVTSSQKEEKTKNNDKQTTKQQNMKQKLPIPPPQKKKKQSKQKQQKNPQASGWFKTLCILQNGHRMAAHNNSNFVTAYLKNTRWKMGLKIFIIFIRIC